MRLTFSRLKYQKQFVFHLFRDFKYFKFLLNNSKVKINLLNFPMSILYLFDFYRTCLIFSYCNFIEDYFIKIYLLNELLIWKSMKVNGYAPRISSCKRKSKILNDNSRYSFLYVNVKIIANHYFKVLYKEFLTKILRKVEDIYQPGKNHFFLRKGGIKIV